MLKKLKTKARPRLFKPGMPKSRWKSNICVGMAFFLLLSSVSLLHTKIGADGTLADKNSKINSVRVSKSPAARKELINKPRETSLNEKTRILDKTWGLENLERFHTRFGEAVTHEGLDQRENLEIKERGEDSDEDEIEDEDEDSDAGGLEMEGFDGFEDKIDEMEEDEVEEKRVRFSEKYLSGGENRVETLERQDVENGSKGRENNEKSKVIEYSSGENGVADEGRGNSGKRLERLGQIKTIPRSNYSDKRTKTRDYILSKDVVAQKTKPLRGRAGLFWDHVMGVTRRAFLKHPKTLAAITNTAKPKIGHGQESNFDIGIQADGEWEDAIDDVSVAGGDDRIKEAFSSDDEPIDEGIRKGLEEVYAIEDALLLKGGDKLSPLRSGWGPWFDNIQRRASKSDFLKRDRMAKSTVDLLNPMNNPLLQDPDAVGPAGLTKSDRAIQKALKKASIEGIPFVGKQSFNSKYVPEEETAVEGKRQVHDAVGLQKTLEESNLDGGDEASVKERNNSDNDDDALLKTELTQLTRKALDESDNNVTHSESNVGGESREDLTDTLGGTEQIQSVMPEQVERKRLSDGDQKDNISSLGKKSGRSKQDSHRRNSKRNRVQFKEQGAQNKEETARRLRTLSAPEIHEHKFQGYANGTLLEQANILRVQSRIVDNTRDVFPGDNIVTSNKSVTEDMDRIALNKMDIARGDAMKFARGKATGIEFCEKIQRPGEPRKLNSASHTKLHRKVRLDGDTRRWGYFPGLDPLLSFSEFMDEFLQDGNCSLRVFMSWTTPSWSYSVRYQRGLESLLYFHPRACVMVFSDSIELDFFNNFVNDGYRVAVVMPNLDELLVNTPAHIFASVWLDWRKVDLYYIHYTELLRVAVLYKYGGVYLDSDIIVLKALDSLNNTIGVESPLNKEFTLNGAVMAFENCSPFLLECLSEFTATYDDTLLRWNGAELLTRVAKRSIEESGGSWVPKAFKIQPHWAFFPLSFHNISSYFAAPSTQYDKEVQDELFNRILNGSFTFHFWNNVTSNLVPESGSLVERILNYHCLHCTDFL